MPVTEDHVTFWEVSCTAGAGQVEAEWHGLRVFVDQPGRSCVVDSDRYHALRCTFDGKLKRVPDTDDVAYDLAVAVLNEFHRDLLWFERLVRARAALVAWVVERHDELERAVLDQKALAEAMLVDVADAREELARVATDMGAPLPYPDELENRLICRRRDSNLTRL